MTRDLLDLCQTVRLSAVGAEAKREIIVLVVLVSLEPDTVCLTWVTGDEAEKYIVILRKGYRGTCETESG